MKTKIIFIVLLFLPLFLYAKKPRIAIIDFENKTGSTYGHWEIGEGIADMLATALVKSGKFDVFERQKMEAIIKEQKLGLTGLVTPESAAKLGKILGVQYIVVGSVNQFGQKTERAKAFGISVDTLTARVATDVRIINVESSRIIAAEDGKGEETATGVSVDNADILPTELEFGSKGFDETIIGKATKKCVNNLVDKISKIFEGQPVEGKIMKIDGKKVYINLGKDSGISTGQTFIVMRKGEELIDPDIGESLGSEDKEIGKVKIVEIKDKFCIAEIVEQKEQMAKDDIAIQKK